MAATCDQGPGRDGQSGQASRDPDARANAPRIMNPQPNRADTAASAAM